MELTTSLAIESWVLFALGVIIVACRIASRRIKLGKWRALMIDDYLMIFALFNFTGVVVTINEVAKNGSNYMPPEAAATLSPAGVQRAVYGSIMTFVLELFTLTAIWTVKACLLLLYARLTINTLTRQHTLVKIAAIYCAVTYLAIVFMFIFFWCRPTREYWAVPVKIMQCATYYHHMMFATACNISSDLLLLFIPIPIIIKTRLAIKRKVILCLILGLGVFNILASILNRYYNFSTPNSYVFLYWYVAEVGVAVMVGNLPLCWPILRLVLGNTDTPSYHGDTISGSTRKRRLRNPLGTVGTTGMGTNWDKLEDQECNGATSEGSHSQQVGSDHGSQIELVLQGHQHNHHHLAAVSANRGDEPEVQQPCPARVADATSSGSGSGGDKIVVITTVDVSSGPPR
ncbi:UbiD family decarboxylase [Ophiocordyceps sinensis CO18]|uniref:UbiD family decarboxylase n=1 Tax=Ophiocordyceps sinensis (strain Co18 / CGMCC 3.14243) TaxID=911162 RepID=T5AF90_OPHSC|nr:UbiD family decarboxylase [Ophiocordyceps sinensis CO18]